MSESNRPTGVPIAPDARARRVTRNERNTALSVPMSEKSSATSENLVEKLRERVERGEFVPLSELLFAQLRAERFEDETSPMTRDRRDTGLAHFRIAAEQLRAQRMVGTSEPELMRDLLDRFYAPNRFRYVVSDNDLLHAFAPERLAGKETRPTGNCESRALAILSLCEEAGVGDNLYLEMFSDHARAVVADRDGKHWVLEGPAAVPYEPDPETRLVPARELKLALAGLASDADDALALGNAKYHSETEGGTMRPANKPTSIRRSFTSRFGGTRAYGENANDDHERPGLLERAAWAFATSLPRLYAIERRVSLFARSVTGAKRLRKAIPAIIAGLFLTGPCLDAAENHDNAASEADIERALSSPAAAATFLQTEAKRIALDVVSAVDRTLEAIATFTAPKTEPIEMTTVYQREEWAGTTVPQSPQASIDVFLADREPLIDRLADRAFWYSASDYLATYSGMSGLGTNENIAVGKHVRAAYPEFWTMVFETAGRNPQEGGYEINLIGERLDPNRVAVLAWRGFSATIAAFKIGDQEIPLRDKNGEPININVVGYVNGRVAFHAHDGIVEIPIENGWRKLSPLDFRDELNERLSPKERYPEDHAEVRREIEARLNGLDSALAPTPGP